MPDYGVTMRDAYDYGSPKWPWVLLVLVVLGVGGYFAARHFLKGSKAEEDTPAEESTVAATEAAGAAPEAAVKPVAPAPGAPTPVPPEISAKIDEAFKMADDDALVEARAALLAIIDEPAATGARKRIESRLGEIDIELITTPRAMPEKIEYAIEQDDQIRTIARKFGTTRELVIKSNNVRNPDVIKIGDRLRVLDKPEFAIHVDKTANDLLLTLNGKFFKRYVVSTGKYGRTPVGTFTIALKEVDPVWYIDGRQIPFGDKENILGTRWMAIASTGETMPASGYGIHGTWDPDSLGKQASAGCVRMRNEDVEELFMIVPVGTPVTIVE